ncbi:MAG: hypothetical protein IKQ49_05140 [Eubacterium sp.]|nr:hypothetical protein [Eubacterium sp.]
MQFTGDLRCIRIETADGLRFYIGLHPTFGWMYDEGTLAYYRIGDEMQRWIEQSFGN